MAPQRRTPPTRPEVADTSVLIPYIRSGLYEAEIERLIEDGRLYLTSLTALELYAGTRDQQEKRALDSFVSSFERRDLVLVPALRDHTLAGMLLSRHRRPAGTLSVRDHLVDVLIVLSASQIGGTVLTANVRHLELWAGLARRSGRTVHTRAPHASTATR